MYGFSLGYFTGDYSTISGTNPVAPDGGMNPWDLYNGNISRMKVNTWALSRLFPGLGVDTGMAYRYRYDQLNRLTGMNASAYLANTVDTSTIYMPTQNYGEHVSYDPNGNIMTYFRNGTTAGGSPLAMDSLSYKYQSGNNRLDHVNDAVPASNYSVDIDNEDTLNYQYDQIGNLTKDSAGGIDTIYWTVYGKIQQINKYNGDTIRFHYDPSGNRIAKEVYKDSLHRWIGTYYVHDATGNIMSTYHWYNKDTFDLDELVMYGSSRLGTIGANQYLTDTITRDSLWYALHPIFTNPLCDSITYDATGLKQYEFTNHLGNVLVTLTDKHIPFYFPNFTYYYPEVASAQDYYPFGMIMPGRNYRDSVFRFGFNGQEKDNEVYGVGDAMTADFWEYDPRLGRRWNTDPVMKPWESSYSSFRNAPILFADPHGDDVTDPNGKNVTAGETIGQSDDKRTLYNSPNTNGNWDHATWNDKDGVYDFHYTNKKDEPSESSKPAEAKEPINATPPITNIGCHPDNTYLHVEAHNVYEYNKKLYTSLDFEHGQFAPSRNRLLDVLFGERTTSDGKALKSDGYINPYPILELTLDDGNPLMPGGIREFPEGAFSIVDWEGYPDGIPKPQGPFVLLEKQDWEIARKLADNANKALHRANPALDGLHIHEIHPVKFGGNPTSLANKTFLSPAEHRKLNTFWYNLQRSIQKKL